jgi:hypothetical protein
MRKPRAHFLAFATPEYALSLELSVEGARPYFESIRTWDREELKTTQFYRDNREILDQPRGAGYWLWKPYIIRERLREIPEGDILMYLDAGARIIADPTPLFEIAERVEIMVFAGHYAGRDGVPYRCAQWTKRDCFVLMGCDSPEYHEARMLDASILLVKNGPRAVEFIDEWLRYASIPEIVTDQPNTCGLPNLEGFVDHRHDQSIMSVLAARDALELFRAPSRSATRSAEPRSSLQVRSPYAAIVNHHRVEVSVDRAELNDRSHCDALLAHVETRRACRVLQVGERGGPELEHVVARSRVEVVVLGRPSDTAAWNTLTGQFDLVLCSVRSPAQSAPVGLFELFLHSLLGQEFAICWTDLAGTRGFLRSAMLLRAQFHSRIDASLKVISGLERDLGRAQVIGILRGIAPTAGVPCLRGRVAH